MSENKIEKVTGIQISPVININVESSEQMEFLLLTINDMIKRMENLLIQPNYIIPNRTDNE